MGKAGEEMALNITMTMLLYNVAITSLAGVCQLPSLLPLQYMDHIIRSFMKHLFIHSLDRAQHTHIHHHSDIPMHTFAIATKATGYIDS